MVIAENDQSGPLGMVPISHTKTAISWDDGRAKELGLIVGEMYDMA